MYKVIGSNFSSEMNVPFSTLNAALLAARQHRKRFINVWVELPTSLSHAEVAAIRAANPDLSFIAPIEEVANVE